MNDTTGSVLLIGVALIVGLVAILWLARISAHLVVAFTYFVMELPTLLVVLFFILFPPALLAFLVGYALIQLGFWDERAKDK